MLALDEEATHGRHLARHLQELRELYGEERAGEILAACGLALTDGSAVRAAGGAVTDDDCRRYQAAVLATCGEIAYRFARVALSFAECDAVDEDG